MEPLTASTGMGSMTAVGGDLATLLTQVVRLLAENQTAAISEPRAEMPQDRVLLTVEEAAERLRIGRTTAWGLVKSGELHSVRIGRLRRVPSAAVETYAARLLTRRDGTKNSKERRNAA